MFTSPGTRAGRGESRAWYSKLFDRIFGKTVGYFLQRTSTGWRAAQGTNDPYPSGTSNPLTPTTNDKIYRTDLNLLCYYDGTRWLTVNEYSCAVGINASANLFTVSATNTTIAFTTAEADYQMYITSAFAWVFTGATNNGTAFYTYDWYWSDSAGTLTSVGSFDTSAQAANTRISRTAVINSVIPSTAVAVYLRSSGKTGAPSNQQLIPPFFKYRLIIP